jgi:hypothetical protein
MRSAGFQTPVLQGFRHLPPQTATPFTGLEVPSSNLGAPIEESPAKKEAMLFEYRALGHTERAIIMSKHLSAAPRPGAAAVCTPSSFVDLPEYWLGSGGYRLSVGQLTGEPVLVVGPAFCEGGKRRWYREGRVGSARLDLRSHERRTFVP